MHTSPVNCVAFSKDAKFVATGSFGYTQIFHVTTGVKVSVLCEYTDAIFPTMHTINAVCFSPNGKSLATAGGKRDIRIWDLGQECILGRLSEHEGYVTSLDYSSSGHFLVSASSDGTVKLWDMDTKTCLYDLPLPKMSSHLIWNTVVISQDETIIGASAGSGDVFVWECDNGTWKDPTELRLTQCPSTEGGYANYIAFTAANNRRLCRRDNTMVGLFELPPRSEDINQSEHLPPSLPTLKTVTEWRDNWDLSTSLSWSGDGRWIISGEHGGRVQCWDEHGHVQFTLYGHSTGMFLSSLGIFDM